MYPPRRASSVHSLADTVTLNLMAASPSLGKIATVAVLTNTFMTFPVFVTPVLRILENLVYTPENIEEIEEVGPISEEALFRESIMQRLDSMSAQIEVNTTVLARLARKLDVPLPRHEDPDTASPPDDMLNNSRLALAGLVSPKAGRLRPAGGNLKRRTISMVTETDASEGDGASEDEKGESIFIGLSYLTFSLRVGLVVLAAVLAVTVPNFGFIVALMGAVTTMLVSFILPTAFYVLVHWGELNTPTLVMCALVVLLGFVGMVIGLHNTLYEGV